MIITNGKGQYAMSVGNTKKTGLSITWTNNASFARVYNDKTATRLVSMVANKGEDAFSMDETGLSGFTFDVTRRNLRTKKAGETSFAVSSVEAMGLLRNRPVSTDKKGVSVFLDGDVKVTVRRHAA